MSTNEPCEGCGAAVPVGATACTYCGRPHSGAAPVAPPPDDPATELRKRFDALDAHPEAASAALVSPPMPTGLGAVMIVPIVFGAIFAGFGLLFIVVSQGMLAMSPAPTGFRLLFLLIPGTFVVLGIVTAAKAAAVRSRFTAAPMQPLRALVVGKRTEVTRKNKSTTTTYYVTLAGRDGRRREYKTVSNQYGLVAEGDMGVAYVKDEYLLGLRRIDV